MFRIYCILLICLLLPGVRVAAQTYEIADSLWKIAETAEKEENWATSALYFEKAANAEKACDSPRLEDLYYELSRASNAYVLSENVKKAIVLRIESYTLCKAVFGNEHANVGLEAMWVGLLLANLQEYEKALPFYLEALDNAAMALGKDHPQYLLRLNYLAEFYNDTDQPEKALTLYVEALENAEKNLGKQHEDYGVSLMNLAKQYKQMGQYENAVPLYVAAIQHAGEVLGKQHPDYSVRVINLANLYQTMGQYEKALPLYLEFLDNTEKTLGKDHANYGTGLNNLGQLYISMGQYEKALPPTLEALENTKKSLGKQHPTYGTHLNNLAGLYKTMGQYNKALPLYLEALENIANNKGIEDDRYGMILNNLGELYTVMGQYDKALPIYLEAQKNIEQSLGKAHPSYGKVLNNLAVLYKYLGQYDKALPLYLEALEISEKSQGKEQVDYAIYLSNLADLYGTMGRYDQALPLYLQALEITERSVGKNHPQFGNVINNLAALYRTIGQYQKALPLYLEALENTEQNLGKEHMIYGMRLNNLAELYETMGQYSEALSMYKQALENTEKSLGKQHEEYGVCLNNLAGLYSTMAQYEKALPLYLEALENTEKSLGKQHPSYGIRLNNLGELYLRTSQFDKALPVYLETIENTERTVGKEHENYGISINNLAALYQKICQYDKALPLIKVGFQNIKNQITRQFGYLSEKEKEQFLKRVLYFFDFYQGVFNQYPQKTREVTSLAMDIEITRKGLLLQSNIAMRNAILQSNDAALLHSFDEWSVTKSVLAREFSLPLIDRRSDLAEVEKKAEQLEAALTRKSSNLKGVLQVGQIDWQQIQKALPERGVSIEFISFASHNYNAWTDSTLYMAMILRKTDTMPQMISLFEQKQLDSLLQKQNSSEQGFVTGLYRGIKAKSSQQDVYNGRKLYDLIWKPLDSLLQPGDDIYLAPSGTLHQLAFAAFPYDSATTLSDRYPLHMVATPAVLLKEKASTKARTLSVFGGVQFDEVDTTASHVNTETVSRSLPGDLQRSGENWDYLPGTLLEAESIAATAKQKGMQVNLYSGKAATEQRLKGMNGKNAPDVLHIATHGFFFPDPKVQPAEDGFISEKKEPVFKASDNPLNRSGIVLAGANKTWSGAEKLEGGEDGILTAYEASYLQLANTKLVVLSACETGLGDVKGSEGVYGLQRAFKQAGAEYLLMSLWKVPDNETAEFMTTFYGHYFGGSIIEEAYLLTQKTLREKYRNDPYKWAAFVLMR
jgi:tetratricopeptide (TPR) repeat protein/CHAT domain-containing protein